MKIDKTSFYRNSEIKNASATSPWGCSIGQSNTRDCRIDFDKAGVLEIIVGMTYKAVSDPENIDISKGSSNREKMLCAKFDKVYINDELLQNQSYILCVVKEHSKNHDNRLIISYANYITYRGESINYDTINAIQKKLCKTDEGSWFIYDLSISNQDELKLLAIVLDDSNRVVYQSTDERSAIWDTLINQSKVKVSSFDDNILSQLLYKDYNGAPQNMKMAAIHSFGIQYGSYIKNASEVVKLSGLNASYATELSKGINIYKTTRDKIFGLSFGNLENTLIEIARKSTKMNVVNTDINKSLQQIFYGAPGTGKSHEINKQTAGYAVIRTTFHPDSDYSTFVGCYKPSMMKADLRDGSGHIINDASEEEKNKITYKFVKQAFLKAYLGAWKKYSEAGDKNAEPQFLVIEEINRGNCAQIFGDLFQLLDREDNGFSSYPIDADTDLQQEIANAFVNDAEYKLEKDINIEDAIANYTSNYGETLSADIQNGRVLLLPPNLYIWATMNTSDQSLFPIDSAFKRRWDWKYMPINTRKENWSISVNGKMYSWSDFLDKINYEIGEQTSSEDKKLGFYFCKAENNVISAERFVSKVLFYIYNDVFKDYEFDRDFFKRKSDNKVISFQSLYDCESGNVNESVVAELLDNLEVDKEENNPN